MRHHCRAGRVRSVRKTVGRRPRVSVEPFEVVAFYKAIVLAGEAYGQLERTALIKRDLEMTSG